MDSQFSQALVQFKNHVGLKFQLYNSLFTSLPFHRIERTGILLSLFQTVCEDGYKKKLSPSEIIDLFFSKHTSLNSVQEKSDVLFRFIQYVERQVVLFDALEDAGFSLVNDISGVGTLKQLSSEVISQSKEEQLAEKLKDFEIRLVLTAHPTQFYPGSVLGIINDLSKALMSNNTSQINMYLQQLGKTPFFNKAKPTPYDEAVSLIWYLENVFYHAGGKILSELKSFFRDAVNNDNPIITMGFWPGGDRDGNPNVTADTTIQVAEALRGSIIKCYYIDVRKLKRRLTFKGIDVILQTLEKELYKNLFTPGEKTDLSKEFILKTLYAIRHILIYDHNGLFLGLLDDLINKVHIYGLHFAALDVRQESSVHTNVVAAVNEKYKILPDNFTSLSEVDKINCLLQLKQNINADDFSEPIIKDTLQSMNAIRTIQKTNGTAGCSRYIISQTNSAINIAEVIGLFMLCGWEKDELEIDVVPLFETVEDMKQGASIMKTLYSNKNYMAHLAKRNNRQTIMLGFSDGTKDGGYLMANWGIYKAKEELTTISNEYGIVVVFFDGRGGPPARGGGKTHKFYASMGRNIANKQIQLTIQGQTVSSNFGTIDSAKYNIEQLLNAGISNELFSTKEITLTEQEDRTLSELSEISFKAYQNLKNNPDFLDYLLHISPLNFYSETNIGSRPAKRGTSKLNLKDLRAIPFVGAWSQLKQNVTGYYGVGYALKEFDTMGRLGEVKSLYKNSVFFKTLIDNCEMAMKKCFFPLTESLADHPKYGEFWRNIFDEFELTQKYIFQLTGSNELMADYPVEQLSIAMRERIVLPLLTIQQYAIAQIRELEMEVSQNHITETFKKLVIRCSFGIINAGRNSA